MEFWKVSCGMSSHVLHVSFMNPPVVFRSDFRALNLEDKPPFFKLYPLISRCRRAMLGYGGGRFSGGISNFDATRSHDPSSLEKLEKRRLVLQI